MHTLDIGALRAAAFRSQPLPRKEALRCELVQTIVSGWLLCGAEDRRPDPEPSIYYQLSSPAG